LLEDRNGRECLAFQELQECPTPGGNVADIVGDAVLGNGRQGVATTGDGERGRFGDSAGYGFSALGESIELEHAHRAVPDYGTRLGQYARQLFGGAWTNVENHVIVGHVGGRLNRGLGLSAEGFCAHDVNWDRYIGTALLHLLDDVPRLFDLFRFHERLANGEPGGQHEGIGDTATHDELVHLFGQGLQDRQLSRD